MKLTFSHFCGIFFTLLVTLVVAGGLPAATVPGPSPDFNDIRLINQDDPAQPYHLVGGRLTGDHLDIRVLRKAAFDFNRDGRPDGVVVTLEDYGGSGNFRVLNLLINRRGKLLNTDRVQLGDRIRVESLQVEKSGRIVVSLRERTPGVSYAEPPTRKRKLIFTVKDGALIQVPETCRGK